MPLVLANKLLPGSVGFEKGFICEAVVPPVSAFPFIAIPDSMSWRWRFYGPWVFRT